MSKAVLFLAGILLFYSNTMAQEGEAFTMSLNEAIKYAIDHQPLLEQMRTSEEIIRYQIKSESSAWLPQLGLVGNYSRYFEQPVAIFPDFDNPESGRFQEVRTGVPHNASINFTADQSIFNNELFRINAQSSYLKKQASQSYEEMKIELTVEVSKAFYEVMLAQEQIYLTQEDLQRQEKQLNDAILQYEAGLTDNIDSKRALITLQNTRSALFQYKENYKARSANFKALLGMKGDQNMELVGPYEELLQEVEMDTLLNVEPGQRIEIQILNSQKAIQDAEIQYNKRRYIPSLTAFYNYNILFLSPQGGDLFNRSYPFSLIGARLNIPIFQGGKRMYDSRMAALQLRNLELEQQNLENEIESEHQNALSAYKSNLYQFRTQEMNKKLAEEIYDVVSLQYEQGIKNFLEVFVAETDLRTSRINYYRALFSVLSSKLDLQKARGEIFTDY